MSERGVLLEPRPVSDEALTTFVMFLRMNPYLPADDPAIRGVWDAYRTCLRGVSG